MKNTVKLFDEKKRKKQKISMITCYDYSTAKYLNNSNIDSLLVGDTLGMIFQGNEDTLSVTVDEMIYHSRAVRKGARDKFIVTDLPFLSYHVSVEEAIYNSGRLVKEGLAEAVKLEGGEEVIDKIKGIVAAKIPVMGHLGLTPQSVNILGGFKVQGKELDVARKMIHDAQLLEAAGVFGIVLECVPEKLAKLISEKLTIPTIGIGSGKYTDGQVLVLNDALGLYLDMTPKFVKKYGDLGEEVINGMNKYIEDIDEGKFPAAEHSFKMNQDIVAELLKEFS